MSLTREQWDRLRVELVARVHDLAAAWLSDGAKVGAEWAAGDVMGAAGDSLKLALSGPRAGCWHDWSNDEGGDLVQLRARQWGCTDAEAGDRLWTELGLDGADPKPPGQKPAPRAKADEDMVPAPRVSAEDASWEWAMRRGMPGEEGGAPPVRADLYQWADGSVAFRVLRFNRPAPKDPTGKQFRPLSPFLVDGVVRWKYRDPPGKLPLFNLPIITGTTVAGIVVCEGEKAAEAAARLLPSWVATTPSHGAKSPTRSDWSPLAGRRVVIWPDHDQPGAEFAAVVAGLVQGARILDVERFAERIGWTLTAKADAADVPWPDALVEDAFIDPPLLAPPEVDGLPRPSAPVPPKASKPSPPPPPTTPPPSAGDDDEGEGAKRARTYRRVVSSISLAIEQSGIWPNALNGWRRKDKKGAETGDDELRADFLHTWRLDGRPGERLIDDAWEKVVRDLRAERRRELVRSMTGKPATPAGLAALRQWVIATAIGKVDEVSIAMAEPRIGFLVDVMRQWMWCVKRYALGMPVERELMIVMYGKQASGKTRAIDQLASPWEELSLPITAEALTDGRQAQVLYRGLIARWDELEGAHKADVDALKRAVTSKTVAFRNLYSNAIQERQRTCSFIASTNLPVRQVIKDTSGGRRYVEIETPSQCDFEALNSLDMCMVWDAVCEDEPCPIKPRLAELGVHQASLVHADVICAWLESEEWDTLTIRSADGLKPDVVPGYMESRGYTVTELQQRHKHWASLVGQAPMLSTLFGSRLRQLGFPEPRRFGGRGKRPRYTFIPSEILDGSALWMGPDPDRPATDPLDAVLPS